MGWSALDTAIEQIRDMVGEDPGGARQAIADLLADTPSPSGRVRLWGVMILACCRLGDLEAALHAYEAGRKLRGRSPVARGEFEWQAAELHIIRGDADAARRAAETALRLLRPLALAPEGSSQNAKRKGRLRRANYAAALLMRAESLFHFEPDPANLGRALADVLEVLRLIGDPRHAPRVHLSALSGLCLLVTRVGTAKDVADVLQLADEAEDVLKRRRVPARHPHRVKLRWVRALAFARLGSAEQAERILSRVVEDLLEIGLDDDAQRAGEHLLWIVAELKGHVGRARYLRRRLGLPREMDPPEPPQLDECDPPIGF